MRAIGTRGRVVICELTKEEIGVIADAVDLLHDAAVQEGRGEDALVYDQLAQAAYKALGEVR